MRGAAALALMLACSLCACASPPVTARPAVSRILPLLQVADDDGTRRVLAVRVCRPSAATGPAPIAIINHGAPTHAEDTPLMQPTDCTSEPARWFTARGFVVVFALRRGFGTSEGAIAEESGTCEDPDYVHAGDEGARDIDAIVRWAEKLPGVRVDSTVVVGQSTGGWASLAYGSRPDTRAVAVVDMAGGRGGRAFGAPGTYCHAESLIAAAGRFGASGRLPTLWIYAANDSYFTPDIAAKMHDAYVAAGGHAEMVDAPSFGPEGHQLFYGRGGSRHWGPPVEHFLARVLTGIRAVSS